MPPEADVRSVEAARADPSSIIHLYRRLLAVRHASPALQLGSITRLADLPDGVLGWDRALDGDCRRVLVAFAAAEVGAEVRDAWLVEVSSDGHHEGDLFDGSLAADQAVILTPVRF